MPGQAGILDESETLAWPGMYQWGLVNKSWLARCSGDVMCYECTSTRYFTNPHPHREYVPHSNMSRSLGGSTMALGAAVLLGMYAQVVQKAMRVGGDGRWGGLGGGRRWEHDVTVESNSDWIRTRGQHVICCQQAEGPTFSRALLGSTFRKEVHLASPTRALC